MKLLRMTLLGLAFAVPAACFAQWQWIDKDGRKVFSDQPPPPEVPTKSILKQPGAKGRAVAAEEPASAAASAPAVAAARKTSGNTLKIGGKDKTLEEKKKKADAEEAEKKNAQEEELAKLRADNCQRAKRTKATFDSGVRIAQTNDKGEREFLDDNARAAELKRVTAIIASDCKVAGS